MAGCQRLMIQRQQLPRNIRAYLREERQGRQMVKLRILVAHNFYQLPGGEDQCLAAEAALLEANGHEIIRYSVHNDAIKTLGRTAPSLPHGGVVHLRPS